MSSEACGSGFGPKQRIKGASSVSLRAEMIEAGAMILLSPSLPNAVITSSARPQGSGSEPMNVPQFVDGSRFFGPIYSVAIQTELFAVTAQE